MEVSDVHLVVTPGTRQRIVKPRLPRELISETLTLGGLSLLTSPPPHSYTLLDVRVSDNPAVRRHQCHAANSADLFLHQERCSLMICRMLIAVSLETGCFWVGVLSVLLTVTASWSSEARASAPSLRSRTREIM